ncbi:hypothetical protein MPSEU_001086700 [Mayamaea pseudoterrestris]|nr:hypothetical protein MPSEU_001086700 [Mayamaea pseudoterrestris]
MALRVDLAQIVSGHCVSSKRYCSSLLYHRQVRFGGAAPPTHTGMTLAAVTTRLGELLGSTCKAPTIDVTDFDRFCDDHSATMATAVSTIFGCCSQIKEVYFRFTSDNYLAEFQTVAAVLGTHPSIGRLKIGHIEHTDLLRVFLPPLASMRKLAMFAMEDGHSF